MDNVIVTYNDLMAALNQINNTYTPNPTINININNLNIYTSDTNKIISELNKSTSLITESHSRLLKAIADTNTYFNKNDETSFKLETPSSKVEFKTSSEILAVGICSMVAGAGLAYIFGMKK